MDIVRNPFQEGLSVQVSGDTSGATRALSSLQGTLGSTRLATLALGGALAAVAAGGMAKAVSAASEWEDQLVEISKVTDDATAEELDESLQEMAEDIPVAAGELANVAETAGRLGVEGSDNIEQFTRTISKLSIATDLTADQAAKDFARLSNALDVPIERMEGMGSAVNTLANNFAASTSEIVDSMTRAAPAAAQLGVAFDQLAAIQTTLVASGMRVQRAGTRMNRAFTKLSQNSSDVADAVGMSADEFNRLIQNDPTQALFTYLEHLQDIESSQERVNEATEIFGTAGAKAVLTLASNFDDLQRASDESNQSMEEGKSLNEEYEKASETFSAKTQELKNSLGNLAREIGEDTLPALGKLASGTADVIDRFTELIEKSKELQKEEPATFGARMAARQREVAQTNKTLNDLQQDTADIFETTTQATEENTEALEENEQQTEETADAKEELAQAGEKVKDRLISPTSVDQITDAFLDMGDASLDLGSKADSLRFEFQRESAELRRLQDELRNTEMQMANLGEQSEELQGKMLNNRIETQELQIQKRKLEHRLGRLQRAEESESGLTEEQAERKKELEQQLAQVENGLEQNQRKSEELRLEQLKLKREEEELKDTREEQAAAVEKQEKVVSNTREEFETFMQRMARFSPDKFINNVIDATDELEGFQDTLFNLTNSNTFSELQGKMNQLRFVTPTGVGAATAPTGAPNRNLRVVQHEQTITFEGDDEIGQIMADQANSQIRSRERRAHRRNPTPSN